MTGGSAPEPAAARRALPYADEWLAERELRDVVHIAARVCGTPVSLVTIIDGGRQRFMARHGFVTQDSPMDVGFCPLVVASGIPVAIADTAADAAHVSNPATAAGVRFYAGVPLVTPGGHAFGTLCVLDNVPHVVDDDLVATLEALARQVMGHLELRAAQRRERESEARHRHIAASALDHAIVATDLGGRITEWDSGAEAILGWREAEMRGDTADRLFLPEDRAAGRIGAEMRIARETGKFEDERWQLRADGRRFWASGEMTMLTADDGTHVGYLKVMRDRTAEHVAGQKLAESEARYRSLFEAIDVGFCVIEMKFDGARTPVDYRFIEVNPAFERQTGLVDVAGRWMRDLAPGHEQHWFDLYGRVATTGESVRFDMGADALGRHFDVHAYRIGADTDRRVAILFEDVSKRRAAEAAREASEAYWRGLFERLNEGFFEAEVLREDGVACDWRFTKMNAAFEVATGISRSYAIERSASEVISGLEPGWIEDCARVAETGEPASFTREIKTLGRTYRARTFPTGRDRFAVIFSDISTRVKANARREAMLAISDRLRDLHDRRDLAFAAAEIVGRTLDVARAGYAVLDVEDETAQIERDWTTAGLASAAGLHPFRQYGSYIEDLARGDEVVIADITADPRTATTAPSWVGRGIHSLINVPVVEDGRAVALFFVIDSKTRTWSDEEVEFLREVAVRTRTAIARRLAEEELMRLAASLEQQVADRTRELSASESKARAYFDLSPEYLLLVGVRPDGRVVFEDINPVTEDLFGWTRAEVAGRLLGEVVTAESAREIERHARTCYGGGQNLTYHAVRNYRGDKEVVIDAVVALLEKNPDGSGLLLFSGRDSTEQRRIEEQLRQSQKMEAVGQLTGGLAHDFNNLLTGITGSLDMLKRRIAQGRTDDIDRYLDSAQRAAARAAALTHRLLAFSRRQTLDPRPTDVPGLVAGMRELIDRTVGPAIHVEVVAESEVYRTLVDPSQLENALLNLCINARDAMPDGGRIVIETRNETFGERAAETRDLAPGDYVSLSVSDTGTGMPPEVIARIFDPFYTTKPTGLGTGLGLSMIYGFARQSNGQIRVHSQVGTGTTMRLLLPRHDGPRAIREDADLAEPAPRADAGETVLVVDDEPSVRLMIVELLEDLGYAVIAAETGAIGLRILQSDRRVDLLVTDVGLPGGMNGRQVADAGRALRPRLKVLFITGYAEGAVFGESVAAEGMAVMTKPFAMDDLASRVRSLL